MFAQPKSIAQCAHVVPTFGMPLKPGGDRIRVVYTIKKSTAERIKKLAEESHRPMGQLLDKVFEKYELKE
jgi:hypothetical protein